MHTEEPTCASKFGVFLTSSQAHLDDLFQCILLLVAVLWLHTASHDIY
jgi:hypothetical protein